MHNDIIVVLSLQNILNRIYTSYYKLKKLDGMIDDIFNKVIKEM